MGLGGAGETAEARVNVGEAPASDPDWSCSSGRAGWYVRCCVGSLASLEAIGLDGRAVRRGAGAVPAGGCGPRSCEDSDNAIFGRGTGQTRSEIHRREWEERGSAKQQQVPANGDEIDGRFRTNRSRCCRLSSLLGPFSTRNRCQRWEYRYAEASGQNTVETRHRARLGAWMWRRGKGVLLQ